MWHDWLLISQLSSFSKRRLQKDACWIQCPSYMLIWRYGYGQKHKAWITHPNPHTIHTRVSGHTHIYEGHSEGRFLTKESVLIVCFWARERQGSPVDPLNERRGTHPPENHHLNHAKSFRFFFVMRSEPIQIWSSPSAGPIWLSIPSHSDHTTLSPFGGRKKPSVWRASAVWTWSALASATQAPRPTAERTGHAMSSMPGFACLVMCVFFPVPGWIQEDVSFYLFLVPWSAQMY